MSDIVVREVYSWANPPKGIPEVCEGICKTVTVGYRSVKERVDSLLLAGIQLSAFRTAQDNVGVYDFSSEMTDEQVAEIASVLAISRRAGSDITELMNNNETQKSILATMRKKNSKGNEDKVSTGEDTGTGEMAEEKSGSDKSSTVSGGE